MNRCDYLDKRFTESKVPLVLIFMGVFAFSYLVLGGGYAAFESKLIVFNSFRGVSISLIIVSSLVFFAWLLIGNVRVAIETLLVAKKISLNGDVEFLSFVGVTRSVDRSSILSIVETQPIHGFWSMSLLSKQYRNYEISLPDDNKVYVSGDMPGVKKLINILSSTT